MSDEKKREYIKSYMSNYIKNAKDTFCSDCGSIYKSYRKHKHLQSKKHIKNVEQGNHYEQSKKDKKKPCPMK